MFGKFHGKDDVMAFASERTCSPQDKIRPLYILPFVAILAVLTCAPLLCEFIGREVQEEAEFPLSQWIFFASSALFAPVIITVCKLLPDLRYSLGIGGLVTIAGLVSTAFVSGSKQMFTFCILVGIGGTMTLTATSIALVPYFVQRSVRVSVSLLVAVALLTVVFHTVTVNLMSDLGNKIFVVLSPLLFMTSAAPIIAFKCVKRRLDSGNNSCLLRHDLLFGLEENNPEAVNLINDDDCDLLDRQESGCEKAKVRCIYLPLVKGWMMSFVSVLVWLFWGVGVDTSWMAMVETLSPNKDQIVVFIQLLFAISLFVIKLLTEPKRTSSKERIVYGCNYMYLCLLGVGGLLIALLPDHIHPLQNQMIFTMTLGLQFDDLSDLDVQHYKPGIERVLNGIDLKQLDKLDPKNSKLDVCCLICHILSLLMMSCLAMLLGLHLAYGLIYIFSGTLLSYTISNGGLCFVSAICIAIGLSQPDYWIR